jgi:hypothetical protein
VTDLEGKKAAGLESLMGLGDEAAVDVEAVGASEERSDGLVLANLRMELRRVGERDIRRIADDGVEVEAALAGGKRGQEVGEDEVDAWREVVRGGVRLGDAKGFGGEVDGGDVGLREMCGERDGDGSGAGADVRDGHGVVGCCSGLEVFEDCFD